MNYRIDPIVLKFKHSIDDHLQGQIERVVLFGSRARGDNRADSDYDIAVFLNNKSSHQVQAEVLADLGTQILYETGKVINALPLRAGSWNDETGFMQELRKDGVGF